MSAQGTYRFYSVQRQTILLINGEPLGRGRVKTFSKVTSTTTINRKFTMRPFLSRIREVFSPVISLVSSSCQFTGSIICLCDNHNILLTLLQLMGEMEEGDAFGELALLQNTRRTATIICKQDSEFLRVDRPDFDEVC